METEMKRACKSLAALVVSGVVAGCSCVDVTYDERARIEKLHAQGISWRNERNAGRFQPPVDMTAAVFWSLLPGAGQHFMAHKAAESGVDRLCGQFRDRRQLRTAGTLMLATSWIPYVYCFTLPLGLASGTVVDVNRINNLALLEQQEARNSRSRKGDGE